MTQAIDRPNNPMRRYYPSVSGYATYPPVSQFDFRFGAAEYRHAATGRTKGPIAIYVHVPFCFSDCYYCSSEKVVTHQKDVIDDYLQHLCKEIAMQGRLLEERSRVNELHVGGGTPSSLGISQLQLILKTFQENFRFADGTDFEQSIKVDPRTTSHAKVRALAALGFNRMNIGVQDFDPAVQAAVNRVQTISDTRKLITVARQSGFSSVSVNLIYGLPLQSAITLSKTLEQLLAVRPDRIAACSYIHAPILFATHKKIRLSDLPNAMINAELLQLIRLTLENAGYVQIGSDQFVLPDDSLAKAAHAHQLHYNSQGYSIHSNQEFLGVGMSAISRVGDIYCQNAKSLQSYQRMLDAGHFPVARGVALRAEDKLRGEIIESILCEGEIPVEKIEKKYGISFVDHFASALRKLRPIAEQGLIDLAPNLWRIKARGKSLLQDIAIAFDEHLTPPESSHCNIPEQSEIKPIRAGLATRPALSTAYALEMQ